MIVRRSYTDASDADFTTAQFDIEWDAEERDETWMVSYADLISTALAMVVLLFGRLAVTEGTPAQAEDEIATAAAPDERTTEASELAPPLAIAIPAVPVVPAVPTPEDRLALLVETRFDGRIKAEQHNEGVVLTIPEVALFDSARAALQSSASALLADLVATLGEVGEAQISVEGHTDNRPITGGEFHSNWDLAAARANAVTRHLLDYGFDPKRLSSVSYADTRPVADNGTAEGRAANRRVELEVEFVGAVSCASLVREQC